MNGTTIATITAASTGTKIGAAMTAMPDATIAGIAITHRNTTIIAAIMTITAVIKATAEGTTTTTAEAIIIIIGTTITGDRAAVGSAGAACTVVCEPLPDGRGS